MTGPSRGRRRRCRATPVPALAVAGGVAATVLTLGASGTLSSWTSAVIDNPTNTVATDKAVVLKETDSTSTCYSSDGAQATVNSSTCTTVNSYGGAAAPLIPGGSQSTDVTFTDVGAAPASSVTLNWGACSQSPAAGTGTPPALNVCTNADLTIALSCSSGTTYTAGTAWTDLKSTATAPGLLSGSLAHAGVLAAGASFTCRFTASLLSNAAVLDQGVTVTQDLSWTLTR